MTDNPIMSHAARTDTFTLTIQPAVEDGKGLNGEGIDTAWPLMASFIRARLEHHRRTTGAIFRFVTIDLRVHVE